MSTSHNMQPDGPGGEIFLVPYQVTNFFAQQQQHSELAARISTQRAATAGRDTDPFLGNALARAWYRDHPEEYENDAIPSDEVGG